MKLIILIALITTSQLAYSRPAANIHLPILGDRAETIGNFKVNFDKMPGGQATDSFLMNSISLGLGSRVELGIIPWVYASSVNSFMKYGATVKYNFYKGREFQWSVGGSQIKGEMRDGADERDENGFGSDYSISLDQWWNYQFVSVNYTPTGKRYNLGLTLKYTEIRSASMVRGSHAYALYNKTIDQPFTASTTESNYSSTVTLDMNYQLKSHNWMGLALGTSSLGSRLNISDDFDEEMKNNSRVRYVLGTSYIYRKKLGVLNTPRLSVLLFEGDGIQFGFSTFI